MTFDIYTIGEGAGDKARLHDLAKIFRPPTLALLDRVGVEPGMACLEIGFGIGDISFELARRVGPKGSVVGVDIDDVRVEEARQEAARLGLSNTSFRVADIRTMSAEPQYDLVYSRFVLDHLANPDGVIAVMTGHMRPGGVLIAECTDYTGWYCYPALPAFDRALEIMAALRHKAGGLPDIGIRLPVLFLDAGLGDIDTNIFQHMALEGEFKRWTVMAITGERAEWAIALDLTSQEELDMLLAEITANMDNPRTTMGTPRFVQCWGRSLTTSMPQVL